MGRRKLIIDTDPGVDDALAIFMAFNSPDVRASCARVRLHAACAAACTRRAARCAPPPAVQSCTRRAARCASPLRADGAAGQVEVLGLTTIFGNVTTPMATANALHLCEMAARTDVPVAQARMRARWSRREHWGSDSHGAVRRRARWGR